MANLKNGTLNYFLTKDLDALENRENALKEMNKMDPTYPDPNDPRFTDPAPVFTILNNQLYRDGVSIGKVYNNKTGKVVEITETTETGFKYRDTNEDAIITKDNSIAVVEKLTGLKGEVVNRPNNIITYEASAKLAETTSNKSAGLHTNAFSGANGQLTITNHTFENGVGKVEFSDDVTIIGSFAFYSALITEVKLPDGITAINNDSFEFCDLTSIDIPNGVTTIGTNAFAACNALSSVTFPNTLITISTNAFNSCFKLSTINIPNSVTSIGEYAFNSCSGLTSVTIGNNVTSIGEYAFNSCTSLTSITSLSTTAPTIYSSTFRDIKTGGTLTVSQGSTGYDVWTRTSNYYLGKYNWTKVEQ